MVLRRQRSIIRQRWGIERMCLTFLYFQKNVVVVSCRPIFPDVAIDSDLKVVVFFGSLHLCINGELSIGICVLLTAPRLNLLEPLLLTLSPDALMVGVVGRSDVGEDCKGHAC